MLIFSCTQADPPPFYRPDADAVLAWHSVAYGPRQWPLPSATQRLENGESRAAVFAAALLSGEVLPACKELGPHLAAQPSLLTRPEMRGLARVGELVGALARAKVDSRASLASAWRRQPDAFQREISGWVAKGAAGTLQQLWPRLVAECLARAPGGGGKAGTVIVGPGEREKEKAGNGVKRRL